MSLPPIVFSRERQRQQREDRRRQINDHNLVSVMKDGDVLGGRDEGAARGLVEDAEEPNLGLDTLP